MVDSIGNVSVQTAEPVQKKKSGVGSTILGTVATAGVGGTAGYFASNRMYDEFVREAEAAIAHPDAIKAELLKVPNANLLGEEMIERQVNSTINSHKENLSKIKGAKTKWIALASVVGGTLYLVGKAIFGKKDKAENAA